MSVMHDKLRLPKLYDYKILDTETESDYNDIVQVAVTVANMPIAFISFLDQDRNWFKAKLGFDLNQTSREHSFCKNLLTEKKPFIINNLLQDSRFATNPMVVGGPKLRFYAGFPLTTPDGYVLGGLCVLDYIPNQLSPEQTKSLECLARQVVSLLEMRKKNEQILKSQQSFLQQSKMLALGHMANGISHEINNPLTIIIAKLATWKETINNPISVKDWSTDLDAMEKTAFRISKIIKSLLLFSSEDVTKKEPTNIKKILQESLNLCSEQGKRLGIKINVSTKANINFKGFPNELVQLFLNLFQNSFDSLSKKTTQIKIIDIEVLDQNDTFVIVFTDNGIGIDEQDRDKIFEPFFTTKVVGSGPGLGLSASKGIVNRHGGVIYLNQSSEQTQFVIKLPKK
jgi:two-component system NtrC family sensor kinase